MDSLPNFPEGLTFFLFQGIVHSSAAAIQELIHKLANNLRRFYNDKMPITGNLLENNLLSIDHTGHGGFVVVLRHIPVILAPDEQTGAGDFSEFAGNIIVVVN